MKEKARLECEEIDKEQRTKQEKELSQLKETMRLEREEREEQWERKQKLYELEINQLEEEAKLASTEIEKLRREEERLKRSQEVEQHNNVGRVTSPQGGTLVVRDLIDITRRMKQRLGQTLIKETQMKMETREVTKTKKEMKVLPETREIEGELDGVRDEHTHTEVVEHNGGELADCFVTWCRQLDGLLQERGEGVFPLEAVYDQVGSFVPSGVEGASTVDGCTESLGGMEAPEPIVVA